MACSLVNHVRFLCSRYEYDITMQNDDPSREDTPADRETRPSRSNRKRLLAVILVLASLGIAIGGWPAMTRWIEQRKLAASQQNLERIGQAIMKYETKNRLLPPVYEVSKEDAPTLSWRVLLLPYLGENELYEQFHLDEPWDSSHNRALLDRMLAVYRSPHHATADAKLASYVVPIDPKAALTAPAKPFHMVVDGMQKTVMAIELKTPSTPWTAPDNLSTDDILRIQAGQRQLVLYGDAKAVELDFADSGAVRAAITINGREDEK
jgi:hypothetical protein